MSTRVVFHAALGAVFALALAATILAGLARQAGGVAPGFLGELDLTPLDRSAVFERGRLKSFDSFAAETVSAIAGRTGVRTETVGEDGVPMLAPLPPDVAYLELLIRPDRYAGEELIYIAKEPMRRQLAAALLAGDRAPEGALERFVETGLIARPLLAAPESMRLMRSWSADLIRTSKHVARVQRAVNLSDPRALADRLRIVPPPGGSRDTPWLSVNDLWPPDPNDPPAVARSRHDVAQGIEPATLERLRAAWSAVVSAWRAEDAPGVNAAIAALADDIRSVAPEAYPSQDRMNAESWYFKLDAFTWGWVVYLLSVVLLLAGVAFGLPGARSAGLGAFAVAFLIHSAAIGVRWYIAGRWPNSNMFEAVTTSVWFGAAIALALELAARRTPLRSLFAVGAGVASMAGMMAAAFTPKLDPAVNNMMPILHDVWLYIHTNVIIASYALIAMAAVTAALYLARRVVTGAREHARVGGTSMLLDAGRHDGRQRRVSLGEVLDGATLVLMELSFVMLWAGIIMGAIWADHSWGRPWGWDPKEVFALNTFLVFLVLVHVRLTVRDKGLWTAILALIGCGVMLFNWIVINFVIAGLHSYA